MFGTLGFPELLVIFLVILLLFGAKRLPEIGRSVGRGMREFKNSISGVSTDVEKAVEQEPETKEKAG